MPRPRRKRSETEIAQQAAKLAGLEPRHSAMAGWIRAHLNALEALLKQPNDPWRLEDVAAALEVADITYKTGRVTPATLNARLVEARKARQGAIGLNRQNLPEALSEVLLTHRAAILADMLQMSPAPQPVSPAIQQPPKVVRGETVQGGSPVFMGHRPPSGPLVFSPSAVPETPSAPASRSDHDSEERRTLLALARKVNTP